MRLESVTSLFVDLDGVELRRWISESWVRPDPADGGNWTFHEVDIARVRLIYDLRREFDTPEETVPMILSLVDQIYELRAQLKSTMEIIYRQPEDIRQTLLTALTSGRRAG